MAKKPANDADEIITVQRPAIGSKVRVTIDQRSHLRIEKRPPEITFIGTVVPNFPWCDPNDMCMSADDGSGFIRRIKLVRVIKIEPAEDGQAVKVTSEKITAPSSWPVKGSKGDLYTVSLVGGNWRCDCLAGQHGRACKHVKQVQEAQAVKT